MTSALVKRFKKPAQLISTRLYFFVVHDGAIRGTCNRHVVTMHQSWLNVSLELLNEFPAGGATYCELVSMHIDVCFYSFRWNEALNRSSGNASENSVTFYENERRWLVSNGKEIYWELFLQWEILTYFFHRVLERS